MSPWRLAISRCFSYSSAVMSAISRLSSSLTYSIRALIAVFRSLSFLFSFFKLIKRPRSPSIPKLLFSSTSLLFATTFSRNSVYFRKFRSSLCLASSLCFFLSILPRRVYIDNWCSCAVAFSCLRRSSSFLRFCWFFKIYCLSAAILASTYLYRSKNYFFSSSNCLAFAMMSSFCYVKRSSISRSSRSFRSSLTA